MKNKKKKGNVFCGDCEYLILSPYKTQEYLSRCSHISAMKGIKVPQDFMKPRYTRTEQEFASIKNKNNDCKFYKKKEVKPSVSPPKKPWWKLWL